jgi:hypothetical protein
MTITNGYGTLNGYKERFFDGNTDDHKDDVFLESAITAVSRLIDNLCWRRFYASSTDETRYFTAHDALVLLPDIDIYSVTSIKTDQDGDRTYEETWDTGDYDLLPANASLDGEPYTWIEVAPYSDYAFPTLRNGVEIVGKFGYCAASSDAPAQVAEACYLGAHRLHKRLQTPLGVSAAAALGQLQVRVRDLENDPDFMILIDPYRRRV